MRAIRFDLTIPRYVMGKALGKVADWSVFGAPSGLSLAELPEPALPGPDWVRLEVLMCGICGSDLGTLTFKNSPAMEPFASFPAVLGHETLARVAEVGPAVKRVRAGDRVTVDPGISCAVRAKPAAEQCPSCAAGLPATCGHSGEAGGPSPGGTPLAPGCLIGYHRDLPGGWGERMVAHESQLHPVASALDDQTAVLIEPLAIGVHAALRAKVDPAAPALVIGSGPIALGSLWALRATGHTGPLVAQVKRKKEAELARELGASATAAPGDEAKEALLRVTGAKAYRPIIGPEVFNGGGFPLVFDCVGTRESLDQALRFVAPRGRVVLLGCAGQLGQLDLTFLWSREVEVLGFLCYGTESWRGERLHTFEITNRLLVESQAPVSKLITHRFPLAQYREALSAAAHHRESGAMKVVLVPR